MKPKLSLDLSVILRRYCFFETQEAENDVINEILESIKKRDEYVIGENESRKYKHTFVNDLIQRDKLRIEQHKRQEETL